jgi:squalene-hopene/tetraprenyl-beta-curcumene cyclase
MGLLESEPSVSESVLRGVAWLLERQNDSGSWDEAEFTGAGFPNHFYLRYHLYAHYFPLMALGRFQQRVSSNGNGNGKENGHG